MSPPSRERTHRHAPASARKSHGHYERSPPAQHATRQTHRAREPSLTTTTDQGKRADDRLEVAAERDRDRLGREIAQSSMCPVGTDPFLGPRSEATGPESPLCMLLARATGVRFRTCPRLRNEGRFDVQECRKRLDPTPAARAGTVAPSTPGPAFTARRAARGDRCPCPCARAAGRVRVVDSIRLWMRALMSPTSLARRSIRLAETSPTGSWRSRAQTSSSLPISRLRASRSR
jgi:hypothetical protein